MSDTEREIGELRGTVDALVRAFTEHRQETREGRAEIRNEISSLKSAINGRFETTAETLKDQSRRIGAIERWRSHVNGALRFGAWLLGIGGLGTLGAWIAGLFGGQR